MPRISGIDRSLSMTSAHLSPAAEGQCEHGIGEGNVKTWWPLFSRIRRRERRTPRSSSKIKIRLEVISTLGVISSGDVCMAFSIRVARGIGGPRITANSSAWSHLLKGEALQKRLHGTCQSSARAQYMLGVRGVLARFSIRDQRRHRRIVVPFASPVGIFRGITPLRVKCISP